MLYFRCGRDRICSGATYRFVSHPDPPMAGKDLVVKSRFFAFAQNDISTWSDKSFGKLRTGPTATFSMEAEVTVNNGLVPSERSESRDMRMRTPTGLSRGTRGDGVPCGML